MRPWLDDGDVALYHGSALDVLAALPAESVQMCVTSPPFFNLRDYGVEGQLGLEATPEEYVERMVEVFRGVRRVLRDDGTLWLEIGDSYAGSGPSGASYQSETTKRRAAGNGQDGAFRVSPTLADRGLTYRDKKPHEIPGGLKAKDLIGVPWRLAFALQADGWYLRSDIVWSRPNPMPESVTDRPTKSHSYVFLLSKSARYFFDADAIREQAAASTADRAYLGKRPISDRHEFMQANGMHGKSDSLRDYSRTARNARSVWSIATQPTPEAHFATFPEELVRRCVLAGSSEAGECSACGAPWRRVVERGESDYSRLKGDRDWRDLAEISRQQGKGVRPGQSENRASHGNHTMTENGTVPSLRPRTTDTIGWEPSCSCSEFVTGSRGCADAPGTPSGAAKPASSTTGIPAPSTNAPPPPRPQIVLDPFVGSGTTALVARRHGRRAIGVDLSSSYLEIAARRTQQLSLLAEGPAA